MSEGDEGKEKGMFNMYQNQPFDMEVNLTDDKDEEKEEQEIRNENNEASPQDNQEDDEDQANYQEIKVQSTVKPLPKFDISKFSEFQTTPELKELLSIMQRYICNFIL